MPPTQEATVERARGTDSAPPNARAGTERERRLFLRWRRFGDLDAREQLVKRYLPLAHGLARRFRGERNSRDDLMQVASIGLLKAIDGFDPDRGFAFASFAVPTIKGEMKRHVRDFGWPVHVPRPVRDRAVRVKRTADRLEAELGRTPAVAEVGRECDLTPDEVLEAMEAEVSARLAPLHATGNGDGDEPPPDRYVGVDEDGYELVEYRDAVAHKLSGCSDRDLLMLRLRLVDGLSQREIASRVGLSQMHVSRLLRELLAEPNGEQPLRASGRPRASDRRRVQ